MTREEAISELEQLGRDPNREHLEEKFNRCPELRQVSEALGAALFARRGYSRRTRREDSLPVPPALVHPG